MMPANCKVFTSHQVLTDVWDNLLNALRVVLPPGAFDGSLLAQNPKITRITVLTTNEFSHTFQDGTKRFKIYVRGESRLRVAFIANETANGGNHVDLSHGIYSEELISLTSKSIYFKLEKINRDLSIIEWS